MPRAIQFKNIDWLGEPIAQEGPLQRSTPIRFRRADGTGADVFGRILIRPEEIDQATEEQYLRALREALEESAGG